MGYSNSLYLREILNLNAYIRKEERLKIHKLNINLRRWGMDNRKNPKKESKKTIKTRAEINETENRGTMETTKQPKSWLSEKK